MQFHDQLILKIFRLLNYVNRNVKNSGVTYLYAVEAAQYKAFENKILKNKSQN